MARELSVSSERHGGLIGGGRHPRPYSGSRYKYLGESSSLSWLARLWSYSQSSCVHSQSGALVFELSSVAQIPIIERALHPSESDETEVANPVEEEKSRLFESLLDSCGEERCCLNTRFKTDPALQCSISITRN